MPEEMTAIQIPKRVHRRLRAVCVILDIPIGKITELVMHEWTDEKVKTMGIKIPEEIAEKYQRTESAS
jgi:hypothetical protein